MSLFAEVTDRLRIDLRDACSGEWARLGRPGVWWTGPERLAIAEQVRTAETCALCVHRKDSLTPQEGAHSATNTLPALAVDTIHRIVTDPGRLTAKWYREVINGGLSEGQFVELVGITTTVIFVDTFARGAGVPPPAFPEAQSGDPARLMPPGARVHSAWVPTVDPDLAEGEVRSLYELLKASPFVPNRNEIVGFVPNITRALSLVPPENLGLGTFIMAAYLGVRDISETQEQLLAVTVSTYNDCFY